MALIQRGLLVMATAGALAIPTHFPGPVDAGAGAPQKRAAGPTTASFQLNQLEYYLGDSGIAYIRPGVKITILGVTNATPGNKPVLEFNLTDQFDQPLDKDGKVTPGPASFGFIMGAWDPATRYYIAYTGSPSTGGPITSASRDSGGTYTTLEMGHYKYNFGQKIPADHDVNKTITIGAYASRTLSDIIGKNYYAPNVFLDFRTDGKPVAASSVWNNMDVAKSCNSCHDPLGGAFGATQFHGGTRQTVKMCLLCHNATKGTDGEADAKIFFHKLHMGKNLPSVKAGTPYVMDGDWSTVGWPGNNNGAPLDCTTCHETSAPEKDVWYTRPSRKVCGSCHDNVNFATGENHGTAGDGIPVQLNDNDCATCHQPQGDKEFDASIKGAHTQPYKSTQLKGLNAAISDVKNAAPGKKPSVVLKITNNDGTAVDGSKLSRLGPMIGGPTTSYKWLLRESTLSQASFDATTGLTTFNFVGIIPADATGSAVVSVDMYRTVPLKRGDGKADINQRECAVNPIKYISLDGNAVVERRLSADIAKCNKCHGALGLHGGQRLVVQECVICHNPVTTDGRTAAQGGAESVSFQRMIHRIHTGEELSQPYTIGATWSANEIRYPGDRRNCVACHTTTGYQIPLPNGIDSVLTARDFFTPQGPATAACLGCHDLRDNAAHAYLNTAPFGEACSSCHGVGLDLGVDKVHAR